MQIRILGGALAGNAQVGDGRHRSGVQPEVSLHREIIRERHLGRVSSGSNRRFVCARAWEWSVRGVSTSLLLFCATKRKKRSFLHFGILMPRGLRLTCLFPRVMNLRAGRDLPRVPRPRRAPRTKPTRCDGRDASRTAPRNPRPRERMRVDVGVAFCRKSVFVSRRSCLAGRLAPRAYAKYPQLLVSSSRSPRPHARVESRRAQRLLVHPIHGGDPPGVRPLRRRPRDGGFLEVPHDDGAVEPPVASLRPSGHHASDVTRAV